MGRGIRVWGESGSSRYKMLSRCLAPIVTDDADVREITMLDGVFACILSFGEMKVYLKIQREELQHPSPPKRMKEISDVILIF